jgi:signal transduction histidine kinase/CheY-like chemotaxis protein
MLHRTQPLLWIIDTAPFILGFFSVLIGRRADALHLAKRTLEERVYARTMALEEAKGRAESASRAKSDFLAMMSHEIRTPLHGVTTMLALLAESPLDATQRQYANIAMTSGESLLAIIDDVLDVTRIDSGGVTLEERDVDVRTLVREVLRIHAQQAEEKGLRLMADVSAAVPPQIVGDPSRLRQILTNLVGNAVKFTFVGEVAVVVSVAKGEPAQLQIDVRDTGIGIPSEAKPNLFEAFSQADNSITRRFGGTGLGLAICQRLVALMGGTLAVQSALHAGSTFQLRVPLRLPRPVDAGASADAQVVALGDASAGDAESRYILLVEDNPVNQLVASHVLGKLGHRVEVAANGLIAVAACAREDFDLVLMDCHMPEMDGFEATRTIRARQRPQQPRVPIVAMTADAMAGTRQACLDAGMDDYVAKPVTKDALAALVERWTRARLDQAKQHREPAP